MIEPVDFQATIDAQLLQLERSDLLRTPVVLDSPQGPEVVIHGRAVINLCSNDYLGLANHPDLARAMERGLERVGIGAGASRHVSGSHTLHREAERRLAAYVGLPTALLFSSGYAANIGCVPALVSSSDVIFSDALNHASLIDGCRLSRARLHVYRHLDVEHLRWLLRRHRTEHAAAMVVTESLFSMEGDVAPLRALRALCDEHRCGLMVDEAHAIGVFGPHGRGLCAHDDISPDVFVGTLGKAFGSSGAFVAGRPAVVRLLENRARSYVFSTAPSPAASCAVVAGVDLVESADEARVRVLARATELRAGLQALGYRVPFGETPIIPVVIGSASQTMRTSAALLERGVFVHGIRPPTVSADTCRLRVTTTAAHTLDHLSLSLDAFSSLTRS